MPAAVVERMGVSSEITNTRPINCRAVMEEKDYAGDAVVVQSSFGFGVNGVKDSQT